MKLNDSPIEVTNHFTGQMLRLKDLATHKVNTRIAKFQHGENEKTTEEMKQKIIIEVDKCFDEIFDAITLN